MTHHDFWKNQKAIITAGGDGIGFEIASAMHEAGAQVWICDVDEAALARAAGRLAGIGTMHCDVADPAACEAFVAQATEAMGGLDILVNNAGISGPAAPVQEIDPAAWVRTFEVNVHGQFYMARAAIPHLKAAKGGSIVCMASVAGKYAFALRSPYSSSKAAVIALARALSVELGPEKIRVNAVAPGAVAGERIRRVFRDRAAALSISYEEMEKTALRAVSMKMLVEPEDIAGMVMFLCAPTGRAITGQTLSVCGGLEYAE